MSFDSKKQADDAARVAEYQRGSKLHAYKCSTCDLWHLSSRRADD